MKPERLARTVVYQSDWVNLYVDKVRFPNGRIIERHHLLDFEYPAVVVLIENGDGQILFVRVCRYTTGTTDWELPAGGVAAGEGVMEAARREVREETGYECDDYQPVYSYYPMSGISNKLFQIVRCTATTQVAQYDAKEISDVCWFGKADIKQMIDNRTIVDGPTLTALLLCM